MELDLLIVDDDEDLRVVLVDAAAALGYRAEAVASAREALARLSVVAEAGTAPSSPGLPGGACACVLIDWSLPDLGGAELAVAIHANRPDVRILLMTGHVFTPDTGHPVLRKPFSLNDLGEALRLAIRERAR